jgi:hypothetical protein
MKHIKTFESYVSSISEGLTAMKMKEVIEAVAQLLAGQLSDEGIEPDEVQDFLEENPTAAESTLEGMEEEYGVDLINLWPKMKDEVINKVKEAMAGLESVKSTSGADVNEGINGKAKQLQNKFKDAITVAEFGAGWDDEEEEAERVNGIMKKLGTDAATTLFASDANDPDGYEEFADMVRKSGLAYEEAETPDFVQEIYVAAK